VADFGVARLESQRGDMTAETGTYRWMAPEVFCSLKIKLCVIYYQYFSKLPTASYISHAFTEHPFSLYIFYFWVLHFFCRWYTYVKLSNICSNYF
jgi:hypothetical protein